MYNLAQGPVAPVKKPKKKEMVGQNWTITNF
jgi:hypothetical protein